MKLRHILTIAVLVLLVGTGAAVAIARLAHSPANHVVGGTGATLPYTEIEAEQAATNGTIIGPDITFTHLASEASGRQAVTLTQGQYVEFTLPRAANSIDVRYSIPDSADGVGLTAPIALYINGTYRQDLIFTSRYGLST